MDGVEVGRDSFDSDSAFVDRGSGGGCEKLVCREHRGLVRCRRGRHRRRRGHRGGRREVAMAPMGTIEEQTLHVLQCIVRRRRRVRQWREINMRCVRCWRKSSHRRCHLWQ